MMDAQCGNPRHPDGPWHPATPLPFYWPWWMFWKHGEQRAHERREREHGCGCEVRGERA